MKVPRTPTHFILDTHLDGSLANPSKAQPLYELQVDLLYPLTDHTAHRLALSGTMMPREVAVLRAAEPSSEEITDADVINALHPLLAKRILERSEAAGGSHQYELAYKFLLVRPSNCGVVLTASRMPRTRICTLQVTHTPRAQAIASLCPGNV